MNDRSQRIDTVTPEIATAAAEWFARLNEDDAAEEDFQRWHGWLTASPAHQRAYRQIEEAWHLIGSAAPTLESSASDAEVVGNSAPPSRIPVPGLRHFARHATAAWVAAAAVLIVIGVAFAPDVLQRWNPTTYATAMAEQRSVRLADGSRVTLGARSKIVPKLEGATRQITLEFGEAYFEVAHDASRPFIVLAGGNVIRAVGTAFNVSSTPERTLVSVSEGRVAVVRAPPTASSPRPDSSAGGHQGQQRSPARADSIDTSGEILLSVGQRALLSSAGAVERRPEPAAAIATWRQGRFEYRGEELRYVIEDLNRYTDYRIILEDDSAGSLRYSGTVFPDHLDEWLEGISGALPVHVRYTDDARYLTRAHVDMQ